MFAVLDLQFSNFNLLEDTDRIHLRAIRIVYTLYPGTLAATKHSVALLFLYILKDLKLLLFKFIKFKFKNQK